MTIESDTEDVPIPSGSKSSKTEPADDAKLDPDFVFDLTGDPYIDLTNDTIGLQDLVKTGSKPVCSSHNYGALTRTHAWSARNPSLWMKLLLADD